MSDPLANVLGLLAVGGALALVALLIVLLVLPFARHLPASPVAEFAPPPGDVVEHGLLVRADQRLLAAAIIDLAVRGQVRVLAPRGARGPAAIEAKRDASLTPDERFLLQALRPQSMTPRQQRRHLRALADLGIPASRIEEAPDVYVLRGRGTFRRYRRRSIARYVDARRRELETAGLTRRGRRRAHLILLSLLFLASAAIGLILVIGAIVEGAWWGAAVVVADLAVLFWILMIAPPPLLRFTEEGQRRRRHLSGLRQYIRLAEQERLRMLESAEGALRTPAGALTPGGQALGLPPVPTAGDPVAQSTLDRYVLAERLLPYAILFRQERSWQREFEHLGDITTGQNVRALGRTLEGVVSVLEALEVVFLLLRGIWLAVTFFARH
ncbi:DUF2207 family protein [Microbacterium sp. gxy059]|uniref:DUF2207 family protein n=1 Tax=Microbacterium sp. gxy059 TaxID=2957199 RepID=UPI003D982AC9